MGDPSAIVYVDDDDDQIVDEDSLDGDASAQDNLLENAARIQMQVRLCMTLLSLLPMLGLCIALSWRRYGAAIARRRKTDAADPKEKKQDRSLFTAPPKEKKDR